ncbi:MAG: hypothetical protein AAF108_04785 [Planctomycetota bacterium]
MKSRDTLGKRLGLVLFLAAPLAIVVLLLFAIADSVSREGQRLGPPSSGEAPPARRDDAGGEDGYD